MRSSKTQEQKARINARAREREERETRVRGSWCSGVVVIQEQGGSVSQSVSIDPSVPSLILNDR
jgi:DNA-binding protein YbaB